MSDNPEALTAAKLVARILTDNGLEVTPPDEGTLDDIERQRWAMCVEIAERVRAPLVAENARLREAAHFNGLTPAEAERLAMLAEECGEVVQAACKVLRHGYASRHPDGGPDNRDMLHREVGDVLLVVDALRLAGDMEATTPDRFSAKRARMFQYSHHQEGLIHAR